MNLEAIKTVVTSKTARQVLIVQKHSPRILFAAGVVGVVGATVLACRATLKLNGVMESHEKQVAFISEEAGTEQLSHEDANKMLARANVRLVLDVARLYAPAFGVGILGVASLTGSHVILDKRNSAGMAAYAGLDQAYRKYRKHIVDHFGADVDRDAALGVEEVTVEEKLSDGSTESETKKVVKKGPQIGGSGYAQVFDERSHKFTKEPGMNAQVVMMAQHYANQALRARGHLFLNEVWDMLGLPRTKAGSIAGWVYEGEDKKDGYVTFNVFDDEHADDFVAGTERYIVLDPNVDGPIWDKI